MGLGFALPAQVVETRNDIFLGKTALDGFDLGVGLLFPFADDAEKDRMVASIGPFWDANETWLVLAIGILLVLSTLGARWSQLQWLVAELTVGIGFGLQEIVANFISGLIILFERPIRIGDVVSVGNTSGVVTRINIRATTIRDWDRRELLVPNREFITGQLLNWSLSDSILRIVVPVGIRYGSDVGLAMKIAEEVALDNDDVLDDPESFVVFESFGDNAINLTLRAYVQSISVLMRVKTELHSELNNRLTEAGIVIAYPQRDVHLDTSRPLEISLRQDTTPLADGAV